MYIDTNTQDFLCFIPWWVRHYNVLWNCVHADTISYKILSKEQTFSICNCFLDIIPPWSPSPMNFISWGASFYVTDVHHLLVYYVSVLSSSCPSVYHKSWYGITHPTSEMGISQTYILAYCHEELIIIRKFSLDYFFTKNIPLKVCTHNSSFILNRNCSKLCMLVYCHMKNYIS
jgi:hypothetical protein